MEPEGLDRRVSTFARLDFIIELRIIQRPNHGRLQSLVKFFFLYFQYYLHCFCKCLNHHCGRVLGIILGTMMDPSLSQERSPINCICSLNISSRIVSHHEKTTFSEFLSHLSTNKLKSCLLRLSKILFNKVKIMPFAVSFQHIVEGTKCHPRSVVCPSKCNIIMSSKIRRQGHLFIFFCLEHIVNNFKRCLIWIDIIESKNRLNLLSPFMVVIRQYSSFQSFQDSFFYFSSILSIGSKSQSTVLFQFLVRSMKEVIELVSCHVVIDTHICNNILHIQRSCYEQQSFLAVFPQVWSDWTVIHEHQVRSEQLLIEYGIHLVTFYLLKIASSVRQQSQRNSSLPKSYNSISGSLYRSLTSEQHPINIADNDRSKQALFLDCISGIGDNFIHEDNIDRVSYKES